MSYSTGRLSGVAGHASAFCALWLGLLTLSFPGSGVSAENRSTDQGYWTMIAGGSSKDGITPTTRVPRIDWRSH